MTTSNIVNAVFNNRPKTYKYRYNGQEYTSEWALRRAMPYVSMPKVLTDDILQTYGIEKIEVETPEMSLESAKTTAENRMEQAFNNYSDSSTSYITSSLGFDANCRYRAFVDVSGLILQAAEADAKAQKEYEQELATYTESQAEEKGETPTPPEPTTVTFMDFADQPHQLTKEQLNVLATEISKNGTRAYGVKWAYRSAIESAESVDDVAAIVIEGFDFRPDDQKPKAKTIAQKARSAKKSTGKTTNKASA